MSPGSREKILTWEKVWFIVPYIKRVAIDGRRLFTFVPQLLIWGQQRVTDFGEKLTLTDTRELFAGVSLGIGTSSQKRGI